MAWVHSSLLSQGGRVVLWHWDNPSDAPNAQQMEYLQRSVMLIPPQHARLITRIEARARHMMPQSGGGNDRVARIIRLSHASFSAGHNTRADRRLNVTVIHELGHIIDGYYSILQFMTRQRREPFLSVLRTPYGSGNHGQGECIADCYMMFLITVIGSVSYPYPPATYAYTGAEGRGRFQALLLTPAFHGYSGPGSELRA